MSSQPPYFPPPPTGSTQGGGDFPTKPDGTQDQSQPTTQGSTPGFAIDPNQIAALLQANQKAVNPEITSAMQLYMQIWGESPPGWNQKDHGYIGSLVHSGLNLFEIAAHEMQKPAFQFTQYYRDHSDSFALQLAQLYGKV